MSYYIDQKYVQLISHRVRNFKRKGSDLWNFSCPYCGDSQKNKSKARGFVYRQKNDLYYKCHNCSMSTTVGKLIEYIDADLHAEYVLERYREGRTGKDTFVPNPKFDFAPVKFKPMKKIPDGITSFEELDSGHPAHTIFSQRGIPREHWKSIYYCSNFFEFTNSLIPNKYPSLEGDHPRMIIPFFDEDGEMFAYQGRAFGNEKPKYYTIILDETKPKIFGLDRLQKDKEYFVVEGPIDSLFLPNTIAVAQSDLRVPYDKSLCTLVPDNEPRNKEIVRQIEKFIDEGYRVTLWPHTIKYKDINDMVDGGMTQDEILEIIHTHTYQGLVAKTNFVNWKKI